MYRIVHHTSCFEFISRKNSNQLNILLSNQRKFKSGSVSLTPFCYHIWQEFIVPWLQVFLFLSSAINLVLRSCQRKVRYKNSPSHKTIKMATRYYCSPHRVNMKVSTVYNGVLHAAVTCTLCTVNLLLHTRFIMMPALTIKSRTNAS